MVASPAATMVISIVFLAPTLMMNPPHKAHRISAMIDAGVEKDKIVFGSHPLYAAIPGTMMFNPSTVMPVMKNSHTI